MTSPVFISYARGSSRAAAQTLAAQLGSLAWLDTGEIDDGDEFPQRLLEGLLDARVVVIFATAAYLDCPFCRLEMRLALASGDAKASHVVVAVGDGGTGVLDMLPTAVADQNWPDAEATERLYGLVGQRLGNHPLPLRHALSATDARKLSTAFLEESRLPPPQRIGGISALPPGIATASLGERFVGRGDALRTIHRVLSAGAGNGRLAARLVAGGGFGKTRLAIEYLYRYAASYPGGVFWIDAAASALDGEYWRVLSALDPQVPDLAEMRRAGRDVRRELERALRAIRQPALYVIDNIPEAGLTADPPTISDFCPAVAAVTILATSRQDTREQFVRNIEVDTISRDAAILLLTDRVPGASVLAWEEWGEIAAWVGDLPIALDLLNVSLALGSIRPQALLARLRETDPSRNATGELDGFREALRGQVGHVARRAHRQIAARTPTPRSPASSPL